MATEYFARGNDLIVRWHVMHSGGEDFPLEGYMHEISYSTGGRRAIVDDSAVITVKNSVITWLFPGRDQAFRGKYSLRLRLWKPGGESIVIRRVNAFELRDSGCGACDVVITSFI